MTDKERFVAACERLADATAAVAQIDRERRLLNSSFKEAEGELDNAKKFFDAAMAKIAGKPVVSLREARPMLQANGEPYPDPGANGQPFHEVKPSTMTPVTREELMDYANVLVRGDIDPE